MKMINVDGELTISLKKKGFNWKKLNATMLERKFLDDLIAEFKKDPQILSFMVDILFKVNSGIPLSEKEKKFVNILYDSYIPYTDKIKGNESLNL